MTERLSYRELRRRIPAWRDIGMSWAEIALALNHLGYRRDAAGTPWTGPTVRHLTSGATTRAGYVPRRRGRPPSA